MLVPVSSDAVFVMAAASPNILLTVSENNGPKLGCDGDPVIETRVLDKLANEEVRFHIVGRADASKVLATCPGQRVAARLRSETLRGPTMPVIASGSNLGRDRRGE